MVTGYIVVTIATVNRELPKQVHARELSELANRQDRIKAQEESEFLLREANYLGYTRGWDEAKRSFAEALHYSQRDELTLSRIKSIISPHMTEAEADQYIAGLMH